MKQEVIMEFILNDTYGINGIENIDLREIIEIFGEPDEREIIRDSKDKDFKVNFILQQKVGQLLLVI